LTKATGDNKYTDEAKKIAQAAFNKLNVNGILTENGSSLDEQGAQFKGAFVRGLAALQQQSGAQFIVDFLKKNADSAWNKDKNGDGVIGTPTTHNKWQLNRGLLMIKIVGPNWSGAPQGNSGTTSHAAGVDLLVAAAQAT
jgi:predicted alpha-1,6-mannanase (GH76 family)